MFDIDKWLSEIVLKIKNEFKERVMFIGYQGSYARQEATDRSDVDMVVILDKLSTDDLKLYRGIVKSMPFSDKACGFICGLPEFQKWSRRELFGLYNDTRPIIGDMQAFLPEFTRQDADDSVKCGAEAVFHAAIHNFLYTNNSAAILAGLYKSIFFVLRNEYYLETGEFIHGKKELLNKLSGSAEEILKFSVNTDDIVNFSDFEREHLFTILTEYCKSLIK